MHITFRVVSSIETESAFTCHRLFAETNEAVRLQDHATFASLVRNRSVWCATSSDDEYQALSYAAFHETNDEWEIGGLMVSDAMRGKGLGRIMMRLPLANTIFNEEPLLCDPVPNIVAHVLASNDAPRRIIPELGFVFHRRIKVPANALPGVKADADGMIRGDEFRLKMPHALDKLAEWCGEWDGKLLDGTDTSIDLPPGVALSDWADAFRDLTAQRLYPAEA